MDYLHKMNIFLSFWCVCVRYHESWNPSKVWVGGNPGPSEWSQPVLQQDSLHSDPLPPTRVFLMPEMWLELSAVQLCAAFSNFYWTFVIDLIDLSSTNCHLGTGVCDWDSPKSNPRSCVVVQIYLSVFEWILCLSSNTRCDECWTQGNDSPPVSDCVFQ